MNAIATLQEKPHFITQRHRKPIAPFPTADVHSRSHTLSAIATTSPVATENKLLYLRLSSP